VLARANRVTRPVDFRSAVRRGRRVSTSSAVLHVLDRHASGPTRFGFIVTKAVGGAVIRNTIRRRLRAISHEVLPEIGDGRDVVVRALPGSDAVPWVTLHAEIAEAIQRSVTRR